MAHTNKIKSVLEKRILENKTWENNIGGFNLRKSSNKTIYSSLDDIQIQYKRNNEITQFKIIPKGFSLEWSYYWDGEDGVIQDNDITLH